MELTSLLDEAKTHLSDVGLADGFQPCGVRSMGIMQTRVAKRTSCSVVEPMIALVLQGGKVVQYGTEQVNYRAGDVIVVGHALPMISGRVDATTDTPYIALYVGIDMQSLRSVYNDMGGSAVGEDGRAVEAGKASTDIIDSFERLFRLRRDPVEEQTLGSSALREVYFRVLRSEKGQSLRRVLRTDSNANKVAKAIAHIRKEYRSNIKAADLAALSGMSPSVFYEAFKRCTANSPLQFQKDLRLTEAHHMLQHTTGPISEIAHSVGYESAAQFSREFSRKFGAPPREFVGLSATR